MKSFLESFVKALFPKRCAYCGAVIRSDKLMCHDCSESLPRIEGKICVKCGREKSVCNCKGAEMYYMGLAAPFYFKDNVRKGVHSFKFRKSPDYSEAYGYEMAKTVSERFGSVKFDFITEVPMTEKSKKNRGYNQCSLLGMETAKHLGVEYKSDVLVKLYETNVQHGLKLFLRKGNLTGVFDVKNPEMVKGKNILLCDDVSTSVETLNECAKMLWLYGAKEIYCIVLAVTAKK